MTQVWILEVFLYAHFSLAAKGRMIVLGYINSYHSPAGIDRSHRNATLVTKVGFLLLI